MCSVNGAIHQEPRRLLALQLEAGRRPLSSFDGLSPASSTWVSRLSREEPGEGEGSMTSRKGGGGREGQTSAFQESLGLAFLQTCQCGGWGPCNPPQSLQTQAWFVGTLECLVLALARCT